MRGVLEYCSCVIRIRPASDMARLLQATAPQMMQLAIGQCLQASLHACTR